MVYAPFPFVVGEPVESIARPIVELGFGVIHILEMEGRFCAILQIILVFPDVNEVMLELVNAVGV